MRSNLEADINLVSRLQYPVSSTDSLVFSKGA
jgi:hypothetical protein